MQRIPATIVTGFLGAGKTSLVRHLLAHAGGRRLAVVINEFGELGIDRELVVGCGDAGCAEAEIVELANGCLCCTVADEFLPSLLRLIERPDPPEHIVIETSGLALPKPLVQAFAWPEIRTRTTVDGVLAVVDAAAVASGDFAAPAAIGPAPAHDNPLAEVFADQLACADLVVLGKTDLVAPDRLADLKGDIEAALRPGVGLVEAHHGRLPPAVALGLAAAAEDDLSARPSLHDAEDGHDHDDFESFVVRRGPVVDENRFLAGLHSVLASGGVLRLKGFIALPGRERRQVVQAVGTRLQRHFDRPWDAAEARRTRLVVIGKKGLDRAAIATALGGEAA